MPENQDFGLNTVIFLSRPFVPFTFKRVSISDSKLLSNFTNVGVTLVSLSNMGVTLVLRLVYIEHVQPLLPLEVSLAKNFDRHR